MRRRMRKLILGGSDELVSGGDDDSGQLPDQQNTDQQEPELQDETLLEMGSQIKLKRGQVIQYSLDVADVVTAKVLSRAGKSTGKYTNSYNAEYKAPENLAGTHAYTDFDRVTDFKLVINISENVPATTEYITEEIFETKDLEKWLICNVGKLMKSMRRLLTKIKSAYL